MGFYLQPDKPLFQLGVIEITNGIKNAFEVDDLKPYLRRHVCGDWGEVCDEDKKASNTAMKAGCRILSVFTIQEIKVWIMTTGCRGLTSIMLPDEY